MDIWGYVAENAGKDYMESVHCFWLKVYSMYGLINSY